MNVCQLLLLMMFCYFYVACNNLCFSENKTLTAGRFMFHVANTYPLVVFRPGI